MQNRTYIEENAILLIVQPNLGICNFPINLNEIIKIRDSITNAIIKPGTYVTKKTRAGCQPSGNHRGKSTKPIILFVVNHMKNARIITPKIITVAVNLATLGSPNILIARLRPFI